MSEQQEKPKQYLVMVDMIGLSCMAKLMPGLQFVEVEGMSIPDNKNHQLLVTPMPNQKVEEIVQPSEEPMVA
jgi:hypothetical protein